MTPPLRLVNPSGEVIDPALVDTTGASVGDVLKVLTGPVAGFGTPAAGYTDEQAQDAVGAMVDGSTLEYVDATPLLRVKDDGVTFAKMQNIATARILGRDTAGSGDIEELTAAEVLALLGALEAGFAYGIDNGAAVLTTGEKPGYWRAPFTGRIVGWTLLVKPSGSITVDTWKDTYANRPPTVADTIWSTKPAVSSGTGNEATGLSIAVTKGDILRHNVDSVTTCTEFTLNYHLERGA